MELKLSRRVLIRILTGIVIFLIVADGITIILKETTDTTYTERTIDMFDMNVENNIPTWYSSISLFICALLLVIISCSKAAQNDGFVLQWRILSVGFLYLSLDESATLHEWMGVMLKGQFTFSGIWHFAWVIPALVVLSVLPFIFYKFLKNLQPVYRKLMVISGAIYISGAVGMEMIGGMITEKSDSLLIYNIAVLAEESMEMTGVLFFIGTLLKYIREHLPHIHITISK